MRDMKETTYTLSELHRDPAKVLKACDRYGQVRVRTRAGKTYLVQAEKTAPEKKEKEEEEEQSISEIFRKHRENLRRLGYVPPPPEEMERIDRIIAGEI